MKIYNSKNVFQASLERMRWLFDEFSNIVVSTSSGKDSVVTMELALIVAREKNRLPLKVMFLDQEAEYTETVAYMRRLSKRADIDLRWYQIPLQISNTSSKQDEWIWCWAEGEEWMRPKEPNSIVENIYGTTRFTDLFTKIINVEYKGEAACFLCGIRCEESPGREVAMIQEKKWATYKYVDWGKKQFNGTKGQHYNMYPIYDWTYADVWKAIFEMGWDYNRVYEKQYQQGMNFKEMRVSSLTHEASITSLFLLQEIDPIVYEALSKRIEGVSTTSKYNRKDYFARELPSMFKDWREYRDYLLPRLVSNEKYREIMRVSFISYEERFANIPEKYILKMYKIMVNTIISNDFSLGKLADFAANPELIIYRKQRLKTQQDAKKSIGAEFGETL